MIKKIFYKRGFVIDMVLTTMFLPIPLIIFIAVCVVHYDMLPMYFIIIIASSCFGLFLFVYEQIFIPKIKEFNRIRTEARKIIKAHNQQHFKKALWDLFMKPLIVMPAVKNVHVTREAIDSVINHPVDIILCANGADRDVIDLMYQYKEYKPSHVSVWIEPRNIGVNPIWNKFVKYFASTNYTHIGILSSDVILQHQWLEYLEECDCCVEHIDTQIICAEVDKDKVKESIDVCGVHVQLVTEGTNGIFIWLTREQARIAFPIPEDIKIWFGDNWIHERLRRAGHPTVIHHNFRAFHGGSVTLQAMEGTNALIEQDKVAWETKVKKLLYE